MTQERDRADAAIDAGRIPAEAQRSAGGLGKRMALGMLAAGLASRVFPSLGDSRGATAEAAAGDDVAAEGRKENRRRQDHRRNRKQQQRQRRDRGVQAPRSMPQGNEKLTLQDLDYAGWGTQRIQQWFGDKYCLWPDGHAVNDTWTADAYTPAKTIEKRLWATKEILPLVEVRKETVRDPYPKTVKRQYEQAGVTTSLKFTASVSEQYTDTTVSTSKTNLTLSQKIPLSFGETNFSIGQEFSSSKTVSEVKTYTDSVERALPSLPKGVWVRFLVLRYAEKDVIDWAIPVRAAGSIVANFPKVVGKPEDDPTNNGYFRTAEVTEMVGSEFPSITGTAEVWNPYLVATLTCARDESDPNRRPDDSMFSADNCDKYSKA